MKTEYPQYGRGELANACSFCAEGNHKVKSSDVCDCPCHKELCPACGSALYLNEYGEECRRSIVEALETRTLAQKALRAFRRLWGIN